LFFTVTEKDAMNPQQVTPTAPAMKNAYTRPIMEELAERQLRSKPYLALVAITCEAQQGMLVLRGNLPSYYLKQVAQEAVTRLKAWTALTIKSRL